jgi:hypothetical protein
MGITFKKNDFEQLDFKYLLINQTSGTEFTNYKQVWIEHFDEKAFTLVVPKKSCNIGHTLMVMFLKGRKPTIPKKIPQNGQGKGITYSLLGKVKGKLDYESNKDLSIVELQFTQFDKDGWSDFIDKYKEKQEEITGTLEQMQVYEE